MSGLDQPLLIATTGYHVGHQRSIRAAEEQGYFAEEGLKEYVYDYRGLIPGPFEREGLALAMKEHGVDIAAGANVDSAILQRAKGADVFIVGGWRYVTRPKIVSAKSITRVEQLKGKSIGLRELGGLTDRLLFVAMLRVGVDPHRDVEWVEDPVFAYADTPDHANLLREGKVDAITTSGRFADELIREGYPLLLDGGASQRRWQPGRVIVATRKTIEQRSAELGAFLRGNLRGFWFWSGVADLETLVDLETRMRRHYTHNEDERTFHMTRRVPRMEDALMPLDGRVDPNELRTVIDEMRLVGQLTAPLEPEDLLRTEAMERGFAELCQRPALQPIVQRVRAALSAA